MRRTFSFKSKPRHITPQIDHVRKTSPVLWVINTHIWGFQGDSWKKVQVLEKT